MFHTFDTEVAAIFHDTNIATLFQNLCYWIIHNRTNEKNRQKIEINGVMVERYFTFNSLQAFLRQFPYFSKKQIENYLNKLRENGLIAKGNFNDKGFDRTSWYCLVDEEYWIHKYLEGSVPHKKDEQDENGQSSEEEEKTQSSSKELDKPSDPGNATDISELDTIHPENLQSFHFPERGNAFPQNEKCISPKREIDFPERRNAFPQNGKSISPKGEMHFPKTGNAFPQNGTPIPDINSYPKPLPKPNLKQISAAAVRTTLFELDKTLVLDAEFYPAAADFLHVHGLGEDYLRWFYQYLARAKHIQNLSGYFFKVFFKPVYVERYKAWREEHPVKHKSDTTREYTCPVCGQVQEITAASSSCDRCDTPVDPTESEIARYAALYRMDSTTKERYIDERSRIFSSGGNVSEKILILDRQYGIVS